MSSAAVHDGEESAASAASHEPGDATAFAKRHATLICALLLFVATLGLYARSLRNDFINYDDPAYVTRNLAVQRGLTWRNVESVGMCATVLSGATLRLLLVLGWG